MHSSGRCGSRIRSSSHSKVSSGVAVTIFPEAEEEPPEVVGLDGDSAQLTRSNKSNVSANLITDVLLQLQPWLNGNPKIKKGANTGPFV